MPPGAGGAAVAGGYGGHAPAFAGQYTLAGYGRRVGAAIIDGIIISIPAVIILSVLGLGVAASADSGNDGGFIALVGSLLLTLLITIIVAIFYAPVMMARTNGKTVGRMVAGTRVIRADGQPMTFGTALVREVVLKLFAVGLVNSFTFILGSLLDLLWPLWDDENRALHDFPVNTRTILD